MRFIDLIILSDQSEPALARFFGAFRCGNKPLVLPGEEKRAKLQKKGEAKPSPKRLQKEKDLQYNGSGLATALPKYRRFFK